MYKQVSHIKFCFIDNDKKAINSLHSQEMRSILRDISDEEDFFNSLIIIRELLIKDGFIPDYQIFLEYDICSRILYFQGNYPIGFLDPIFDLVAKISLNDDISLYLYRNEFISICESHIISSAIGNDTKHNAIKIISNLIKPLCNDNIDKLLEISIMGILRNYFEFSGDLIVSIARYGSQSDIIPQIIREIASFSEINEKNLFSLIWFCFYCVYGEITNVLYVVSHPDIEEKHNNLLYLISGFFIDPNQSLFIPFIQTIYLILESNQYNDDLAEIVSFNSLSSAFFESNIKQSRKFLILCVSLMIGHQYFPFFESGDPQTMLIAYVNQFNDFSFSEKRYSIIILRHLLEVLNPPLPAEIHNSFLDVLLELTIISYENYLTLIFTLLTKHMNDPYIQTILEDISLTLENDNSPKSHALSEYINRVKKQ